MKMPARKYFTPAEYLAMEEAAEVRHEYYQGEIYAMAGAFPNHNRIVRNFGSELSLALKGTNCEAFMNEQRLWIQAKGLFTYPDIMVICGKLEFYENRKDTVINPLLIVEVLSDSTQKYDRGEKFEFYHSLPTFQEYILINQHKAHVQQYYLETPNQWISKEYNHLTDILKLAKINFQISLQDIYYRVEFQEVSR